MSILCVESASYKLEQFEVDVVDKGLHERHKSHAELAAVPGP